MWHLKESTLATTPKGHVGTSVGRCRHIFADRNLKDDWVDGSGFFEHRRLS